MTATPTTFDRAALEEMNMMIRTAPAYIDTTKLAPIADRIAEVFTEEAKLRTDGFLSEPGIAKEMDRHATFARLLVEAHEKNLTYGVDQIAARQQDIDTGRVYRDEAGEFQRRPDLSRDLADVALRREWRDQFRALDTEERRRIVVEAIKQDDWRLLQALDETPASLPLLTADHRQMLVNDRRRRAGISSQANQAAAQMLSFEQRIIDRAKRALGMK